MSKYQTLTILKSRNGLNTMSKNNSVTMMMNGSSNPSKTPTGSNSDGTVTPESVCFDIETECMSAPAMHDWQNDFFKVAAGFKPGEMVTMTAGRGTGKSVLTKAAIQKMFNDIMNPQPQPISDLILEENRLGGTRYYTVEPVGGTWADMEAWCTTAFGEPGDMWRSQDFVWPEAARWMQNNRKFWFRNIKDRDWFIMRWRS